MIKYASAIFGFGMSCVCSSNLLAEEIDHTHYGTFGTLDTIETPTAFAAPDANFAVTSTLIAQQFRNTLTFQATPRISASFRYSVLGEFEFGTDRDTFDRSLDLKFSLLDGTGRLPAVAVGFRDLLGTGVYASEYVVASKHFGPDLRASAGLGWGRMATKNTIDNPLSFLDDRFADRPVLDVGEGGTFNVDSWFRGPVAPFLGVTWAATDALQFHAEYGSDAYTVERERGTFDGKSDLSFGVSYALSPTFSVSAYALQGEAVGLSFTTQVNPAQGRAIRVSGPGPLPINNRRGEFTNLGLSQSTQVATTMNTILATDGIRIVHARIEDRTLFVMIENDGQEIAGQAVGRVARAFTYAASPEVATLVITPRVNGLGASSITIARRDLEVLENTPSASANLLARTVIEASRPGNNDTQINDIDSRLLWSLSPYFSPSLFDPDAPFRADFGLALSGRYAIRQNLWLQGEMRQKISGNLDQIERESDSILPRVRTDFARYQEENDLDITNLTLDYYAKPSKNTFAHVSAGLLEPMFGGVSAEVLWKPVTSNLALGFDVNYVGQRAFDQGFGFQDYRVWTGHASAYYAFGDGYVGQVDVGRYLAGDKGVTLSLDRTFGNGWRVGTYATLTDVSAEYFGEGSFDKGISITVPLSWFSQQPTRQTIPLRISPLTRDGGARLASTDRLYDAVSEYHQENLNKGWGRFWR